MRRLAALAALLAAAVTATGISWAAFVDTTQTSQTVGADSVERWLALTPGSGCTTAPGAQTTGEDGTLHVDTRAVAATLDCAFVLRARDTLPEGVSQLAVTVTPDPSSAGPIAGATLTSLDTGAAADGSAVLAGGEERAVRLQLNGGSGTGRVLVTVRLPGETTGFLRYSVPVTVSGSSGGDPGPTGGDPGATTTTTTTTTPAPGAAPSTTQSADSAATAPAGTLAPTTTTTTPTVPTSPVGKPATAPSRPCVSRRRFAISVHLPRREGVRRATVRIGRSAMRVRTHGGSVTATVDLRGRVPGLYTVTVMVRTRSGRLLRFTRVYRTCATRGAHR